MLSTIFQFRGKRRPPPVNNQNYVRELLYMISNYEKL